MSNVTRIRKISVGKDFPDGCLHYQVGKEVKLLGVQYVISEIVRDRELTLQGKTGYNIFITNESGTVLWKTIIDLPVVLENDVNFE